MTRAEAIKQIESLFEHCEAMMTSDEPVWSQDCEALKVALSALRGPTREQVETAWKGKWQYYPEGCDELTWACSRCGEAWTLIDGTPDDNNMNFCHACGAPMTDEAVEMVMRRLEEMRND